MQSSVRRSVGLVKMVEVGPNSTIEIEPRRYALTAMWRA